MQAFTLSRAARQGGFIAVVMLLLLVIGSLYLIVTGLSTAAEAGRRHQEDVTALALGQAKDALIARAALDANRPGSLPCPDLNNDGVADTLLGNNCPGYVGRLPWRTLGLPDLRDAAGERLWYALSQSFTDSPGFRINSDTQGTLVVPGMAPTGGIVAIVLAPAAVVGTQQRSGPSGGSPDQTCAWGVHENCKVGNYLEGQNATVDLTYEQSARCERTDCPGGVPFNDQLMVITHADLFAIVEPVVAKRIEKEIVPQLNSYFQLWGQALNGSPLQGFYPFAAPYIDATVAPPDPDRAQDEYRGAMDQSNGLLPLSTLTADRPGPNPPPASAWIRWEGIAIEKANPGDPGTLSVPMPSSGPGNGLGPVQFTYTYTCAPPPPCPPELNVRLTARLRNAVASLLLPTGVTSSASWGVAPVGASAPAVATPSIDWAKPPPPPLPALPPPPPVTYGDLILTVTFSLPPAGPPTNVDVTLPTVGTSSFLPMTDPSDPATGWFVRNGWHRQTYYAVGAPFQPTAARPLAPSPCPAPPADCIDVIGEVATARAVLVLAGRHIGTGTRTYAIANYFEDQNQLNTPENATPPAGSPDYVFERKARTKLFNDRLVVVAPQP